MEELKQMQRQIDNLTQMVKQLLTTFAPTSFKPSKDYNLFDWLEEWYATYKLPNLKSASLYQIRNCIDVHIKPNIFNKPLVELTPVEIQKALNKIKTTRMRVYTYDVYNASLRQALNLDLIQSNIMSKVTKSKHRRENGKALTKEQQVVFLNIIKGVPLEKLYKFYLLSGCRKAEALTITWQDINSQNKTVLINGTKTDNAKRYIPLFPELDKLLQEIPKTDLYVFPYSNDLITSSFKRLKEKHKLNFTIHSFRHTFATRCLENGIALKVVQKWLGHSKIDTTANIYMHIQSEFEKEEIKKFNLSV